MRDHALGDAHLSLGRRAGRPDRAPASGPGAIVEWVPDHTIPSAGAALRQSFDVEVADGARLILIDAFAAGRVARGEAWRFALLDSALTVRDARGLLLHDRFVLRGGADWDRLGTGRGAAVLRHDRPHRRGRPRRIHRRSARRAAHRRRHGGRGPPAAPRGATPLPGHGCPRAVGGPRLRLDAGPRPPARSPPTTPSQALARREARERQPARCPDRTHRAHSDIEPRIPRRRYWGADTEARISRRATAPPGRDERRGLGPGRGPHVNSRPCRGPP